MMYLLDTNIILELLFGRSKAKEVEWFLLNTHSDNLYMTDFSYHSIGVILFSRNLGGLFEEISRDIFNTTGIKLIALSSQHAPRIREASLTFNLDFDDAYQYVAAKTYDLSFITFDTDFDTCDLNRTNLSDDIL